MVLLSNEQGQLVNRCWMRCQVPDPGSAAHPQPWSGASQRATSELPLQLVQAGLRESAASVLVGRRQHAHQA